MLANQPGQVGADTLLVRPLNALSDPRWEAFVAAHPAALVYHHPSFLRALAREYGQRLLGLACTDAAGQIHGVLPLMATRGLPFQTGRPRGPRLASLPRTEAAGPLATSAPAAAMLLREAIRLAGEGRLLQLTTPAADLAGMVPGLTRVPWNATYVVPLPDRPEALRFGDSRNHAEIKRAVNKAAREGVEVRPAVTEADLRAWYPLYVATMRHHATIPRPYRFFAAVWHELCSRGMGRLLLAWHGAGSARRLIAGSLYLTHGATVTYAFSGRREADLGLRPNEAIHWRAIHDAVAAGHRRYSFGETAKDNPGLVRFKAKWGAVAEPLYRYYAPLPASELRGGAESGQGEGGGGGRLVRGLWRRAPLRLVALTGDLIFRYL